MSSTFTAKSASAAAELEITRREFSDGTGLGISLSGRDGHAGALFSVEDLEAAGIHITLEKPLPDKPHAVIEISDVHYSLIPEPGDDLRWISVAKTNFGEQLDWHSDESIREISGRKDAEIKVLFPGVAA